MTRPSWPLTVPDSLWVNASPPPGGSLSPPPAAHRRATETVDAAQPGRAGRLEGISGFVVSRPHAAATSQRG